MADTDLIEPDTRYELQWHLDRMDAIVRELWGVKSLELHMCDGTVKQDQFGTLRNIRDSWRDIRAALAEKDARIADQGDENKRLRETLSKVCSALGNGAFASPDCSIEFMEEIPREVELVITASRAECEGLRAAVERLPREVARLFDVLPVGAGGSVPWGEVANATFEAERLIAAALSQKETGA